MKQIIFNPIWDVDALISHYYYDLYKPQSENNKYSFKKIVPFLSSVFTFVSMLASLILCAPQITFAVIPVIAMLLIPIAIVLVMSFLGNIILDFTRIKEKLLIIRSVKKAKLLSRDFDKTISKMNRVAELMRLLVKNNYSLELERLKYLIDILENKQKEKSIKGFISVASTFTGTILVEVLSNYLTQSDVIILQVLHICLVLLLITIIVISTILVYVRLSPKEQCIKNLIEDLKLIQATDYKFVERISSKEKKDE